MQLLTWPRFSRFRLLPVGLSFMYVANRLFDYILYPIVVYRGGILVGGAIMTILSLVACLTILAFYDYTKKDWFGIEAIRDIRFRTPHGSVGKAIHWFLNRSDSAAFIVLSLYYDPFIATVWLRQGQFSGLSKRDWWIFLSSLVIANGYWTISCWLGINTITWLWRGISG